MKLLYEWEMGGGGGEDTRLGLLGVTPGETEADYMESLVEGVRSRVAELDAEIGERLTGWRLERIRRVDLAILRIGAYEILYDEKIPTSVAVNEAVEMAKAYSAPESGPFVNGVLGSLARDKGA